MGNPLEEVTPLQRRVRNRLLPTVGTQPYPITFTPQLSEHTMGPFDRLLGDTSRDRFARRVMDGIRSANPAAQVRYDKSGFRLVLTENGREQGYVSLGNLFTEHCGQSREEQDSHIKNAVRACFAYRKDLPDEFDDAKPDLLPTLRSRTYFELTKLQTQFQHDGEWDFAYQPIGEHLALSLVYDLPEAMLMVTNNALAKWGVSFYEALEVARQNLANDRHRSAGLVTASTCWPRVMPTTPLA